MNSSLVCGLVLLFILLLYWFLPSERRKREELRKAREHYERWKKMSGLASAIMKGTFCGDPIAGPEPFIQEYIALLRDVLPAATRDDAMRLMRLMSVGAPSKCRTQ